MTEPLVPDVVVSICHHCLLDGARLPRQWTEQGSLVVVQELPCAGKVDVEYLLRAFEGLVAGVCVVACADGECRNVEGSQRAEVRVQAVRRLLAEIGLEPGRIELCHVSRNDACASLEQAVRHAVSTLCALGPSPLRSAGSQPPSSTEQPLAGPS